MSGRCTEVCPLDINSTLMTHFSSPSLTVAARCKIYRMASNGGVGANRFGSG